MALHNNQPATFNAELIHLKAILELTQSYQHSILPVAKIRIRSFDSFKEGGPLG